MFFLAIFCALAFNSIYIFAEDEEEEEDCWVHIKVDPETEAPGHMNWNEQGKYCEDVGNNCDMIPCDDYFDGKVVSTNGGYKLKLKLTSVSMKVLVGNTWSEYNRDGNNYIFNNKQYLIIDECQAYSFLEGLRIELDGISTDENGNYIVFIPSGSY
jgi:hypothetical protein